MLCNWLCRAVKIDPDFGDAWAYFYKFELQFGTEVRPTLLHATSHVTPTTPRVTPTTPCVTPATPSVTPTTPHRGVGTLSKVGGPKIAGTQEVDLRAKRAKKFLSLIKFSREMRVRTSRAQLQICILLY